MGLIRMLLALSVAVSHAGGFFGHYMMNAVLSVQSFFIISGFLITLILSTKYDGATPAGRRLFWTNRALRIFVPYWTVLFSVLAFAMGAYALFGLKYSIVAVVLSQFEIGPGMAAWIAVTNLSIVGQELSMWLAYDHGSMHLTLSSDASSPHLANWQTLPQAWSMSLELMFYALAPFLVRRHWLVIGGMIVASSIARSIAWEHGLTGSGFYYRFFPFELTWFLAGAVSYRAYAILARFGAMWLPLSAAVTALMAYLAFALGSWSYFAIHPFHFLVLVAASLPFLFDFTRRFRLDRWLGEMSYPIYLIHMPLVAILARIWTANTELRGPAIIASTLLLSLAFVRFVDRPLERWRQARAKGASTISPVGALGAATATA